MATILDMRSVFPRLRGLNLHVVNEASTVTLQVALQAHGFKIYEAEGLRVRDESSLFVEFQRALALPPHFGHNWDALEDCLGDLRERADRRVAIVWRNADRSIEADAQAA